MSDPIRRDPGEFLRQLKRMCSNSHWQKAMFFASRGRMIGFQLDVRHYNLCLYSQAVWGRALEIVQLIDAMNHDKVKLDASSYYYIVNGMANVDHGYSADFNVNHRLERLQHWRVAINALLACEANGHEPTATMYNSAIVACTIPTMERWMEATYLFHRLLSEEHKPHPQMVQKLELCLLRARRPFDIQRLLNLAVTHHTQGYHTRECVVGGGPRVALTPEEEQAYEAECDLPAYGTGGVPLHAHGIFRPMVWRGLWWRWHAVANKYRPRQALKRRQLCPRWSPSGIPGWNKK